MGSPLVVPFRRSDPRRIRVSFIMSCPHHLPQPRRNQSPDKRPQRIHHQIRQFEKAHAQEQLEALDAEGEAERNEGGEIGQRFCPSSHAALDEPMILCCKGKSRLWKYAITQSNYDRRI